MNRKFLAFLERYQIALTILTVVVVYVLAAAIEPCDGHSCTRAEVEATR